MQASWKCLGNISITLTLSNLDMFSMWHGKDNATLCIDDLTLSYNFTTLTLIFIFIALCRIQIESRNTTNITQRDNGYTHINDPALNRHVTQSKPETPLSPALGMMGNEACSYNINAIQF